MDSNLNNTYGLFSDEDISASEEICVNETGEDIDLAGGASNGASAGAGAAAGAAGAAAV